MNAVASDKSHPWPGNLLIFCLFVEAWLIFLHFRIALHPNASVSVLGQAFDFTRESSLPSFWGCLVAFFTGIFAYLVSFCLGRFGGAKSALLGWKIVAVLFIVFAVDDAIGMHERIGAITSLDLMDSIGYKSYPWHIVVAPIFGISLLIALVLIWKSVRSVKGLLPMLALGIFSFGAAFGFDVVEGIEQMKGISKLDQLGEMVEFLPYLMLMEEVLEMAGTTFFLFVAFSYFLHLAVGVCPEMPFIIKNAESVGETAE